MRPSILSLAFLGLLLCPAQAANTLFNVGGQLNFNGAPVNGPAEFQVQLYDAPTAGHAKLPLPVAPTATVVGGSFHFPVDFGIIQCNGTPAPLQDANGELLTSYVQISVRRPGEANFTPLSPRMQFGSVPSAIVATDALHATLADQVANGVITPAQLVAPNAAPGRVLSLNAAGTFVWQDAPSGGGAGNGWSLTGNAGTTGDNFLGTSDPHPLVLKVAGQHAVRYEPGQGDSGNNPPNIIGGLANNAAGVGTYGSFIGSGSFVTNGSYYSFIGAGSSLMIGTNSYYSVLGGGFDSIIADNSSGSVIGGGENQVLQQSVGSTIAGGIGNTITNSGGATIGGGANNIASGEFATVPGGSLNQATGLSSFAAGHRALATNDGAFVWADGTEDNFGSAVTNEFAVRARGGVRLDTGGQGLNLDGTILNRDISGALVVVNTNADSQVSHAGIAGYAIGASGHGVEGLSGDGIGVAGFSDSAYGLYGHSETGTGVLAYSNGSSGQALELRVVDGGKLITGLRTDNSIGDVQVFTVASDGTVTGKAFNTTSDRHAKEGFTAINPRAVLDKVAALPISQWRFKGDEAVSHVGPMAQDFHAAFGLGQDDKHIATVDEEGVALAAIQGLHLVMQEKDAEIHDLKQSVAELKAMVEQLARRQNK